MDYKNGKIYQILNTVNDDVYVGSTTQPLCKRLYKHKADAKVRDCNIHKSIREIGEDNFYIELIETCPCNSREELRAREGYYIRARGTLNKKIEGRTQREWVTENKEHIREQKQQYYKDNIEHKKQYYEDHKQHIIEQHKQHYEENKESILQRNKRYYEDNNKLINERLTCNICGCQVCRRGMTRHQKSKKCKSYVKPIEKPHPNDNYIIVGGSVYLKGESPLEGVWHKDHTPFEVKHYAIIENNIPRSVTITTI